MNLANKRASMVGRWVGEWMRAKGRESQGSVWHYLTSVGSARGNVSQQPSKNRFIDCV